MLTDPRILESTSRLLKADKHTIGHRFCMITMAVSGRRLNYLGTTTVYVTHDQTEAMTLGHRIAVLRRGEIQQVGSPQDLYRHPANVFVAGFIGAPAMNLLPARIEGSQLVLPMTSLPMPQRLRDALPAGTHAVIAGIRPEHFHLVDRPPAGAAAGELRIRPDLVEWLGADVFVHFEVPANGTGVPALRREQTTKKDDDHAGEERLRITARIAGDAEARDDREITLAIDPEGLLLFDADRGVRLGPDNG